MSDINVTHVDFSQHLVNLIGKTVTIFTASGGKSSHGFTGVLLTVNESYVRIITKIGPAPDYPLNTGHPGSSPRLMISLFPPRSDVTSNHKKHELGTFTDIPVDKIVAILYNTI